MEQGQVWDEEQVTGRVQEMIDHQGDKDYELHFSVYRIRYDQLMQLYEAVELMVNNFGGWSDGSYDERESNY